jgi:hypothetical protein
MTSQVVFAVLFCAAIAAVFFSERRRRLLRQPTEKKVEAELPELVRRAARHYEAKFGRPSSVIEGLEAKHQR